LLEKYCAKAASAILSLPPSASELSPQVYNGLLSASSQLLLRFSAWVAALQTMGAWGMFLIATIDSCSIPMPLDVLVAGYVFSNPHQAWLYCLAGAAGSALGSLVPYALGRAGGEIFLLKRINQERLQRIRDRFQKQEFLALMVPAMLPPPTPFKLFVFSAGVFEMKVALFLLAIMLGRLVRFGALAVLTVFFGPQIVARIKYLVTHHLGFTLLALAGAALVAYVIYRLVRAPVTEVAWEIEHPEKKTGNNTSSSS
jgi:membrane protein YqaA with SNARE-associated domain